MSSFTITDPCIVEPCPCCQSRDAIYVEEIFYRWRVGCDRCKLIAPPAFNDPYEAVEIWNELGEEL